MDYDGTLTTTHKLPEFAKPSAALLSTLKGLAAQPNSYVYVLSGRARHHLDSWFSSTGIGLSAEHGCFYKHPERMTKPAPTVEASIKGVFEEGDGWNRLVEQVDSTWKETIRPLFQHYTERTPNSYIDEHEVNLTWNYRNSDPEFGTWQATE